MHSEQLKNGLIVQIGSQKHELNLENGIAVTVFEVNAVTIIYGTASETSNKVGPAARGVGLTEQEAWEDAVARVKAQLSATLRE